MFEKLRDYFSNAVANVANDVADWSANIGDEQEIRESQKRIGLAEVGLKISMDYSARIPVEDLEQISKWEAGLVRKKEGEIIDNRVRRMDTRHSMGRQLRVLNAA